MDEKRKLIAEFCGWTKVHIYKDKYGEILTGIPPKDYKVRTESHRKYGCKVPNYCYDLNAIYEAEECLAPSQLQKMASALFDKVSVPRFHASAMDRVDAFLEVIKDAGKIMNNLK